MRFQEQRGGACKVNVSCCPLRPRTTPFPEENSILGVIYGVLLWADMNAATPPGSRGRSALCAGVGLCRCWACGSRSPSTPRCRPAPSAPMQQHVRTLMPLPTPPRAPLLVGHRRCGIRPVLDMCLSFFLFCYCFFCFPHK